MSWTPFALPTLPPGVTGFGAALGAITDGITTTLRAVQAAANLLKTADLSILNADQLAVQAAVAAVQKEVDALYANTGVYLLMVPVRRKVVIPAVVQNALNSAGTPNLPAVSASPEVIQALSLLPPIPGSTFYSSIPGASGGNAGFLKTVVESLYDAGDPNRPKFDSQAAVAGVVMVAGAEDYLQLINLASTISAIFGKKGPDNALDMPELPVPQNLKSVQTGTGVLLQWDPTPPTVIIESLGIQVRPVEVAILRSNKPGMFSKISALATFGTNALTKGLSAQDVTVIDVVSFSAAAPLTAYLDETVDPKESNYWYSVCYHTRSGIAALGNGMDLGFGKFSAVRKVKRQAAPPRRSASKLPDWHRSPSAIETIPTLAGALDQLKLRLAELTTVTNDYKSMLGDYITYLDQEIARFTAVSRQITDKIAVLSKLLASGTTAGAYFHTFAGKGGNQFLLTDLASGLTGKDTTRPPFDKGTEYVMGFVLMAGAPTLGELAPVQALFSTLFGGAAAEQTAVSKALAVVGNAVNRSVDEIQASLIANGFAGGTPQPTQNSSGQPLVGADDDGTNKNC